MYGVPMLKIRRSRDRLIFNMGIQIWIDLFNLAVLLLILTWLGHHVRDIGTMVKNANGSWGNILLSPYETEVD